MPPPASAEAAASDWLRSMSCTSKYYIILYPPHSDGLYAMLLSSALRFSANAVVVQRFDTVQLSECTITVLELTLELQICRILLMIDLSLGTCIILTANAQ